MSNFSPPVLQTNNYHNAQEIVYMVLLQTLLLYVHPPCEAWNPTETFVFKQSIKNKSSSCSSFCPQPQRKQELVRQQRRECRSESYGIQMGSLFLIGWMGQDTSYTLKTPGTDLTQKRVPWGQTHSWVRLIWNPGTNYRNLSPICLSDSDSGSVWLGFRVSLTWIPGRSDPKMGLAPSDSFPGQIWPGSF